MYISLAFTPPKAVTPPVAAPPTATAAGRVSCNGNSTSGLRRNQHLTNRAKNRNEELYKEPTKAGIAGETKFFGRDDPVSSLSNTRRSAERRLGWSMFAVKTRENDEKIERVVVKTNRRGGEEARHVRPGRHVGVTPRTRAWRGTPSRPAQSTPLRSRGRSCTPVPQKGSARAPRDFRSLVRSRSFRREASSEERCL